MEARETDKRNGRVMQPKTYLIRRKGEVNILNNRNITQEDILNMNLKELKNFCKKYSNFFYDIKSSFSKDIIISKILKRLQAINMRNQGIYIFDDLYHDKYGDNYNINTLSDNEYYYFEGLASEFRKKYIDTYHHSLKFDTVVFRTINNDYMIIRMEKYSGYNPAFGSESFNLGVGGKHSKLMQLKYRGDLGFSLVKNKGVLLINGVINDYYFDTDMLFESGVSKKCHDIKYLKAFIANKQDFIEETGEYSGRCYSTCEEGSI